MSVLFPCLSWVQYLWDQLCSPEPAKDLPYEIIADILSRLPAECAYVCGQACRPLRDLIMTPSFVGKHLNRATPVIAFQHFEDRRVREVCIDFYDEVTRKTVRKSTKTDLNLSRYVPFLYGSYNGFLMFRFQRFDSALFLWNPITEEKVSLTDPDGWYNPRGFFFHPTEKDYKVLSVTMRNGCFEYVMLSLKMKTSRLITKYSHPPCSLRSPTVINGVLHWMVCDETYYKAFGEYPSCSDSILALDINSEKMCSMQHPGHLCGLKTEHSRKMKLMEKEGKLCLCDDLSCGEMLVWILEDYLNKVWVKRYVIPVTHRMHMEALNFHKDELLLRCSHTDLYLFNPQTGGGMKKINTGKRCNSCVCVIAVPHIDTLVSLDTDSIIRFPPIKNEEQVSHVDTLVSLDADSTLRFRPIKNVEQVPHIDTLVSLDTDSTTRFPQIKNKERRYFCELTIKIEGRIA